MKRFMIALVALTGWAGMVAVSARDVEADPNKPYPVAPEAGPWMICASSYNGPQAAALAQQMVLEIRAKYNLPAFVFNKGAKEREEQEARLRELKEKCPEGRFGRFRIQEQYAVLVGGYKDMDAARKALDHIKKMKPTDKLAVRGQRVVPGVSDKGEKGVWVQEVAINPFWNSFVVRNPTVPADQQADKKGPDLALKKWNENETYSVFKCGKPWTLVVATFQGTPVVRAQGSNGGGGFLDKLTGNKGGEQLAASALNAHEFAQVLRKLGFEAYVMHTSYYSVVTVGSFDRKDDPHMRELEQAIYKRLRFDDPRVHMLMAQPLPMEVPRS